MQAQRHLDGRPATFKKTKLSEFFVFKMKRELIREGDVRPRFYLPVRRTRNDQFIECWYIILAPFVLSFYLLKSALRALWFDLADTGELWFVWSRMNSGKSRKPSKEQFKRAIDNTLKTKET